MKDIDKPIDPETFDWKPYADGHWRLLENHEIEHYFGGSRDRAIGAGRGWAHRNGLKFHRKRRRDGIAYAMITNEQDAELRAREQQATTTEQSEWTDKALTLTAAFLRKWAASTDPEDAPPSMDPSYLRGIIAAADRIDPANRQAAQ